MYSTFYKALKLRLKSRNNLPIPFGKMQLFFLPCLKNESGAKMSHFRITKGGTSVVNYVVLIKRTKKADTKHLHFPKIK